MTNLHATLRRSALPMGALLFGVAFAPGLMAAGEPGLGGPLAGLSQDELQEFREGEEEFKEVETLDGGLGPVFNGRSCAECHAFPTTGGSSPDLGVSRVTRIGRLLNGVFDPLADRGGMLLQARSVKEIDPRCPIVGERVPREATLVSRRITTPLYGAGLIEAIPDSEILRRAVRTTAAAPAPAPPGGPGAGPGAGPGSGPGAGPGSGPGGGPGGTGGGPGGPGGGTGGGPGGGTGGNTNGPAGVPNMVLNPETGRMEIGRFGWKGHVSSLHVFAGDAYLNEMGITSPTFPDEVLPQGQPFPPEWDKVPTLEDDGDDVNALANYMRTLGPPARQPVTPTIRQGEQLFVQVGCESCHTRAMNTGSTSPVAALRNRRVELWSDLLLHDMGNELADGMVMGQANSRQWRTTPLWGLGRRRFLLHDGRTTNLDASIRAHGGEGARSRDQWQRLSPREKQALNAFLASL